MERRLFEDGGYYLDNGASVCGECHIKAEQTVISCDEIREAAGISTVVLPSHLYSDHEYDKWGNVILPNGNRLKGELFYDESVQKIIAPVLHLFLKYVKYPRTYHVPWSQPDRRDDMYLSDMSQFEGRRVVVTEKMDGENTTMYNDYIHARSINSGGHESRKWVKGLWGKIGWEIPDEFRICGENLYAKHSVAYDDLKSYFLAFSMWDGNTCLDWDETLKYLEMLDLEHVPVLYEGMYDEDIVRGLEGREGWVIRLWDSFKYRDFRRSVAKKVNDDFVVGTHGHWFQRKIDKNHML